ncbi:pantoate--beta-alanine ligase [Persephonella hydrogeniphila]|uniref:Pantothenate synthetase n=1 Tax=Persephonella hydrogeniphila TaxID=198703 RepID=A0A285N1U6_9AQUI|nr:pantoate--beta-alanine ligase [Persephonella hydrogeniphila]SNZ03422.1 pantoate--beta-alanine ligase [Persephonella hydrogeniphila]
MLVRTVKEMKSLARNFKREGKSIGFVPTMGYLHEGHISLMRCSKKDNDITVVSIFVNPIQFGENEDLDRYPRDLERDLQICKDEGVDFVFYPSVDEMYPEGFSTYVEVEDLTDRLCGAFRSGHFRGVTTVVNKLFNIVQPDRAYFGEKDYQQLKVIQRMVKDLNMDVEVIGCPIVREKDGLALSSRNKYLSERERESALSLSKALFEAKKMFEKGEKNPEKIISEMKKIITSYPEVKEVQYIEIVDPETLKPKKEVERGDIIAVAVFVGNTRLIDNIKI